MNRHTADRWFGEGALPAQRTGRLIWVRTDAAAAVAGVVLSDRDATVIGVEHWDRLARVGVEHLAAAWSAQGRRVVVADPGETTDDVVPEMVEVLSLMCARRYGRRGARHRVLRPVTATMSEPVGD